MPNYFVTNAIKILAKMHKNMDYCQFLKSGELFTVAEKFRFSIPQMTQPNVHKFTVLYSTSRTNKNDLSLHKQLFNFWHCKETQKNVGSKQPPSC